MSKRTLNLGKVVGRTPELRINEKVIQIKYDDETEWRDLAELADGLKSVELFSELPEDASENDVAIVETEEYIRTDTETVTLPIEVKAPEEDSEMPNIYNIKFKDRFDSLLSNDELKALGAKMLNVEVDFENCYFMFSELSPEAAMLQVGVSHPVRIININVSDEQMLFYVDGVSIKDFLYLMMELELEEEQWTALLGSYANDKSEDSPFYGWISLTVSDAPLAENTALIEEGTYVTFNSNVESPEINDFLNYVSIIAMNEKMESVLNIGADLYDYEDWEDEDTSTQTLILKCSNILFNHIAHGGVVTKSKEIYNPKGLFQKDKDKWVSLEEKMNTPRFVDTYFDLPKNSFENAIMAVMKESQFTSDAEETTDVKYGKTYKLLSADNLTTDKFNSIVEGILPGYPTSGSLSAELYFMQMLPESYEEMYFSLIREASEDGNLTAIMAECYMGETPGRVSPSGSQYHTNRRMICFAEIMEGFEAGELFPPKEGEENYLDFDPVPGRWYWADIIDDGKDYYYSLDGVIHEGFPTDFQYELLFGGGYVSWDSSVYPVTRESSSDEGEKDLYQFDTKILHFVDSKGYITETYPSGFYRFTNGKWTYEEIISGDFTKVTAEHIRGFHSHYNMNVLDELTSASNQYGSNLRFKGNLLSQSVRSITVSESESVSGTGELFIQPVEGFVTYVTSNSYKKLLILPPITMNDSSVFNSYIRFYLQKDKPVNFVDEEKWQIAEVPDVFNTYVTLKITYVKIDSYSYKCCVEWLTTDSDSPLKCKSSDSVNYDYAKWVGETPTEFVEASEVTYAPALLSNSVDYNGNSRSALCINPSEDSYISEEYFSVIGDEYAVSAGLTLYDTTYYFAEDCIIRVNIPTEIKEYITAPREYTVQDGESLSGLFSGRALSARDELENGLNLKGFNDISYAFQDAGAEGMILGPFKNAKIEKMVSAFQNSGFSHIPELDLRNVDLNHWDTSTEAFSESDESEKYLVSIEKLVFTEIPACYFSQMFGSITRYGLSGGIAIGINGRFATKLRDIQVEGVINIDSNFLRLERLVNLSELSLVSILNAFSDNTGLETFVAVLGYENIQKLSPEQLYIAVNKNIMLV